MTIRWSIRCNDEIYAAHYQRLISFYKSNGVAYVLLDSDGFVEPLVPKWQEVGVDILFPVEVGRWHASPADLRAKFGHRLCMMGGVDKHLIKSVSSTSWSKSRTLSFAGITLQPLSVSTLPPC